MGISRYNAFRNLLRSSQSHNADHQLGSSTTFSTLIHGSKGWRDLLDNNFSRNMYRSLSTYPRKSSDHLPWTCSDRVVKRYETDKEFSSLLHVRLMAMATATNTTSQQSGKMGSMKIAMISPGIVFDPYTPREKVSFLRRWFTKTGWRRTKEDFLIEVRSAYAIAKLRKTGYSKDAFYNEAVVLYKEINSLIANGDKGSLRKMVTEKMFSALKNEIKQRELRWNRVYWELIEPVVKIRTLRARLIGVDKDDKDKVFIQLTLEFLAKQKFEAYDSNGKAVAGDKDKEVLVRDIWVFEKSLFHKGSFWRLCGRIKP